MSPAGIREGVEGVLYAIGRALMLTLTDNASTIVKEITSQIGGEGPGLRIATDSDPEASFAITATDHREHGDQVVERAGATVNLESQAADVLSDRILGVGVDEAGSVQFALGQQARSTSAGPDLMKGASGAASGTPWASGRRASDRFQ